jgi:hypothetical protein
MKQGPGINYIGTKKSAEIYVGEYIDNLYEGDGIRLNEKCEVIEEGKFRNNSRYFLD